MTNISNERGFVLLLFVAFASLFLFGAQELQACQDTYADYYCVHESIEVLDHKELDCYIIICCAQNMDDATITTSCCSTQLSGCCSLRVLSYVHNMLYLGSKNLCITSGDDLQAQGFFDSIYKPPKV